MAIVVTNLTKGTDTDGGATATTASISWNTGDTILLTVNSRTGITADPNIPTPTTTGLVWAIVDVTNGTVVYDPDGSSRKRLSVFRAIAASSSSGTIGLDFALQNQTDIDWVVDDVTGEDNVTPIVQVAKATDIDGGSVSATLAAFADATNNAAYGAFASDPGTGTMTQGSGFTKITSQDGAVIITGTEYKIGQDTSVDASFDAVGGTRSGAIAIEIKAATLASTPRLRSLLGVGL